MDEPWRVKTAKTRLRACGRARLWGKHHGKVNQGDALKCLVNGRNCHCSEPVRQAITMGDRDRKQQFRRGGGSQGQKRREYGRPAWRERRALGDEPVILYGWHTVTAALANPERQIRKLWLTENAARRLAEEHIATKVTPEIVRPAQIDQRLGPDAVHQGMLAEADPLPSPDIDTLPSEGIVLVLDQITDPHNVGAI